MRMSDWSSDVCSSDLHVVKARCSYDLVGFQTRGDLLCFHDYIRREAGGEVARDGTVKAFGRIFKAAAFPIGIDTEIFAQMAAESDGSKQVNRLEESLGDRKSTRLNSSH